MGAVRWTYNRCVSFVAGRGIRGTTIKMLRGHCVTKGALRRRGAGWAGEIPFDVRDEGARDLLKAFKAQFAKRRKQAKRGEAPEAFRMSFRRRRDGDTLTVHKKHWGRLRGAFHSLFGPGKLRSREPLPAKLHCDSRLIRDRLGRFFLCMPEPIQVLAQEGGTDGDTVTSPTFRVAALDPGVRTFQTVFSSCLDGGGEVVEWGAGDMAHIFRQCLAADRLQARIKTRGCKNRSRKRRALLRHFDRIRSKINDIQRKLARWLCATHSLILLPSFETQQMIRRGHRRIRSKTARQMCTWAHYRFKQRVTHTAREYAQSPSTAGASW